MPARSERKVSFFQVNNLLSICSGKKHRTCIRVFCSCVRGTPAATCSRTQPLLGFGRGRAPTSQVVVAGVQGESGDPRARKQYSMKTVVLQQVFWRPEGTGVRVELSREVDLCGGIESAKKVEQTKKYYCSPLARRYVGSRKNRARTKENHKQEWPNLRVCESLTASNPRARQP